MGMLRSGNVTGVRVNRTGRRTYTRKFKLDVVRECSVPGVSVSAVAMAHGINTNLVRRWIVHQRGASSAPKATMLPVTIETVTAVSTHTTDDSVDTATQRNRPGSAVIEIELYGARIHLRGGVDAQALRSVLDALAPR